MRIDVLTLFPEMFQGPLTESVLQRARERGFLEVLLHDIRDFSPDRKHRTVDDAPYGGGAGMVMRVDSVVPAIEEVIKERGTPFPHRILLSPMGKRLTQARVERLARKPWLLLLCGHYEGVDQRVVDGGWIDEEIAIGDYVLTGGELPAMVFIDAVARHVPGVLGAPASAEEESFSKALGRKREYPHYTRPAEFRGLTVPDVLLSGDHAAVERWRRGRVH